MSTTSLVRIRIILVPASFEKRHKVLHTKFQVPELVSAKGSPRKLSLFLLELQQWVGLRQYKTQSKTNIPRVSDLLRYLVSSIYICTHHEFVHIDGRDQTLDPTEEGVSDGSSDRKICTSRAGFHHMSARMTLLHAVRFKPRGNKSVLRIKRETDHSTTYRCCQL
jgi:hypothetical protein